MKLEERTDLYRRVAERYTKKFYEEFKGEPKSSSHYRHIAANLISAMRGYGFGIEDGDTENIYDYKIQFLNRLKALRIYLNLIRSLPKFREAEFKTEKGYFTDIEKFICSNEGVAEREKTKIDIHSQYVFSAKKRLDEMSMS